jgi:tryptophan-rich sensory protein
VSISAAARPRQSPSPLLVLLGYVVAVVVVAVVGGLAAGSSAETYQQLDLPPFAPPSSVFGPVWTVLYASIAVAGWLAWRRTGVDRAQWLYAAQLVLNACWTPLFFAGGWYGPALVEIVLLLAFVLATIVAFWRRSRAAALLLVPYAGWVAFATALNASIWWLNR